MGVDGPAGLCRDRPTHPGLLVSSLSDAATYREQLPCQHGVGGRERTPPRIRACHRLRIVGEESMSRWIRDRV
jgi:hypothetical protein